MSPPNPDLETFCTDGYVHLRGAVGGSLLGAATHELYKPSPNASDSALVDLFHVPSLLSLCDVFLGDDHSVLHNNTSFIPAYAPPSDFVRASETGSLVVLVAVDPPKLRAAVVVQQGSHNGHVVAEKRVKMNPGDVVVLHANTAVALPRWVKNEFQAALVGFQVRHVWEQRLLQATWSGFDGMEKIVGGDQVEIREKEKRPQQAERGWRWWKRMERQGHVLTHEMKESFVRDGFVIIKGGVNMELVEKAVDLIDNAYENGMYNDSAIKRPGSASAVPGFVKSVKQADEILDLAYKSTILQAAEELLGKGNCRIRNKLAQIAFTTTNEKYVEAGMSMTEPHSRNGWHIDSGNGKYASWGSDFSLLCGVCLSDGQDVDENRGQFVAWKGSHLITHEQLSQVIKNSPTNDIVRTFIEQELDVGEPSRVLMQKGDVMLAHQRLAHAPGVNLWTQTRKNVYFRLVDRRIDRLLEEFVASPTPWVGFDGLRGLVPEGATTFEGRGGGLGRKLAVRKEADADYPLSDAHKETFVRDGVVVLENVVSEELWKEARRLLDRAYKKGKYTRSTRNSLGSTQGHVVFLKNMRKLEAIKDVFTKSGLVHACEQLLDIGCVRLREQVAEVSYLETADAFVRDGMSMQTAYPSGKWDLDRPSMDYKHVGADSNLLVGIALSNTPRDANLGNLVVWKESHRKTHIAMRDLLEQHDDTDNILPAFRRLRLDVGAPARVPLRAGDAVLIHQRTAYAQGINLSQHVRKMMFFRVVHVEFDELMEQYLQTDHPFVGFKGLEHVVAAMPEQ